MTRTKSTGIQWDSYSKGFQNVIKANCGDKNEEIILKEKEKK